MRYEDTYFVTCQIHGVLSLFEELVFADCGLAPLPVLRLQLVMMCIRASSIFDGDFVERLLETRHGHLAFLEELLQLPVTPLLEAPMCT